MSTHVEGRRTKVATQGVVENIPHIFSILRVRFCTLLWIGTYVEATHLKESINKQEFIQLYIVLHLLRDKSWWLIMSRWDFSSNNLILKAFPKDIVLVIMVSQLQFEFTMWFLKLLGKISKVLTMWVFHTMKLLA